MGNHSSGFNKTFVTNQSHNNKDSKRPHSVLGISAEDNSRCNFKGPVLRSHTHHNENHKMHKYTRPPGMQLPPLPRSHSFHQVLRPTENGQILAAKGTIRGLEFSKPLTNATKSPIADELKAILNSRRCKSETDLAADNGSSHDSNQSEGSNYEDNNKRKEFNGIRKSSASNGVAAKIHRAKYRAPPPPQHLSGSTQDLSATNTSHSNLLSSLDSSSSNMTDSHKKSAGKQFVATSGTASASSAGSSGNSAHNNLDVHNNGLTRKLSQKSYNNHISSDESSRYLIIPRLKLSQQQLQHQSSTGHKDPGNGSAGSGGNHTNNTGANHVMPSRYQSRNIIFDSKNANFEGVNSGLSADCSQDYRKLKRSSSSSNYESDLKNKTKSDMISIDKHYKIKSIERLNRELSAETNNNHNNNYNNYYNHNNRDFVKVNDNPKVRNKSAGSPALPPAFDDNFILRRSTPTAGLKDQQKSSYFFGKQSQPNEKNNKNKSLDTKRAIHPWSDETHNGTGNGVNGVHTNGSRTHHLTNDDMIRPAKPYNSRQQVHTSSTPPPAPPILNFDYEFDISSANNTKSIRTNVSDSANYSDEDEEEEIKVIIRPQLPPLKREQLSESRRERILLSEDLFNLRPIAK
ncbi:unnamed protein product, partial [Oppiella nova]